MALKDAYDLTTLIAYGKQNNYQLTDSSEFTEIAGDLLIVGGCIYDKYIDFIKGFTTRTKLNPAQMMKYKYNPKQLSYDLYGTEELWYLILKLNNLCSEIDFIPKKIYVLQPKQLSILNTINILYEKEITNNHNEYLTD